MVAGNCTLNSHTISWSFWSNANGATINVCWTNTTANTSGFFTISGIQYWTACNNLSAIRLNYTCSTTVNGPASLTANFTNLAWSCTPNTKTFTCSNTKPANTSWNTVSSFTQIWDWSAWTPADSTTAYNTTASTNSCRYKCITWYHTENSWTSCISDTKACTIVNWAWTQTWWGSSWWSCALSSCNSGYAQSGNTCIPKCNTNPSFSNIWTLSNWIPTTPNQAWTYSATPGNCTYTCINWFVWSNCATDIQPPTITAIISQTRYCNKLVLKVQWYADNGPLHTIPYSWDWWTTWHSTTNSESYSSIDTDPFINIISWGSWTYLLKAGKFKARDAAWNIYTNPSDIAWATDCSVSNEYWPLTYSGAITQCSSLWAWWKVPESYDFSMWNYSCTANPSGINCLYPSLFAIGKIYWSSSSLWSNWNYDHMWSLAPWWTYNSYDACNRTYTYCRSSTYTNKWMYSNAWNMYVRCVKYGNPF